MLRYALVAWLLCSVAASAQEAEEKGPSQSARDALEKAGTYFRDHLGVNGTYVWRYSLDGTEREGEGGAVRPSVGWVQPPGTPAIGAAFLRIHSVTEKREWLEAAEKVAMALVSSQLLSGGWFFAIETDPQLAGSWCYRASGIGRKACRRIDNNRQRNRTVMDDNNTGSALSFLIWFDQVSGGKNGAVRNAIKYGLNRLLEVQFSNGAVPAFFSETVAGADADVAPRASIPASWDTNWQKPEKPPYFIINDHLPRDTGRLFLLAYQVYREPAFFQAAMRIGDFLVSSQLPRPQQGWAQQYDRSLRPVWGRKFEPPAVASRETAGSISYLLELYEQTHKIRYLDAAKSAADWLKGAQLPDGSWARFYELNSNRPLYVDNEGKVTFTADNLLDHYNLKDDFDIPDVLAQIERAERDILPAPPSFWITAVDALEPSDLAAQATQLVASQDADGRWTDGKWVDSARFVDAVFVLARFAALDSERGQ